ncbi:hypothetical protein ABZS61_30615 [Streptomyces sp. NPDC005566]|uniref:tetratricopeptide repeat protein n=1 Tax=Streptomyces sp. NPDC005566 TaxID=3156886 RepID=UPI00339F937D
MGQTFTGLLKAVRTRTATGGPGQQVPAAPAVLRLCGDHLAALAASGAMDDARKTRLVASIGTLTTACSPGADGMFDALLRTGQHALEAGGDAQARFALGIAVEATGMRDRSKGAWRLRGRALDALGRTEEAEQAYERHLTLQQELSSSPDIARRLATLRDLRRCLDDAAGLLPDGEDAARLRALRDAPAAEAGAGFADVVRQRTAGRGMSDPAVRKPAGAYAAHRRLLDRDRMADPLLGGTEPIGVPALRRLVEGRSVCVVAGAPRVLEEERSAGSPLGKLIDGYDLVVRCDAPPTGGDSSALVRTDLHALTLRGHTPWSGPGWDRRAATRLVFGDRLADWRRALRARLVPDAQDHIGDASLRRPLSDPALMGEDGWGPRTTTAFTVLRLLDFLDADRLDLIGFGLPGQLLPREHAWVTARATHEDETDLRTQLR